MPGQSVVVGTFEREPDAVAAMRALRVSGIPPRNIGLVERTGEVLVALGLLSDVDVPEHDLAGALIRLGVPVAQARQFWSALERGDAIVTVQPQPCQLRDATITFQSGGASDWCVFSGRLPFGGSQRQANSH